MTELRFRDSLVMSKTARATTPVYLNVVDQTGRHPPQHISLHQGKTLVGKGKGILSPDPKIAENHLEFDNDGQFLRVKGVRNSDN